MRLLHVINLRLTAVTAILLVFWSVFFYITITREINDELDDSLENYAELIIRRKLRGEALPDHSSGSNNQYYIKPVSRQEALRHDVIRYRNVQVYVSEAGEHEPARVISYTFRTGQGQYYQLEVFTPTIEQDDLKESILWSMLILYVCILSSILLINVWGIRYSMRPLRTLLQWLDRYRLNGPNAPLRNPTRIVEFERLNQVVTSAMQRNEEVYRQQRLFIGNASHELQTPLAAALGRIEMMLEDDSLSEHQMGELIKLQRTLTRLSKVNRSLLMLTKIDNGQYAQPAQVDMGQRLSQLIDDYESAYGSRHLQVQVSSQEPLVLQINEALVDTLLANLLKNAFVHNVQGGSIRITITRDSLTLANTGTPHPLDKRLIFTPFYHTPDSPSSTDWGWLWSRPSASSANCICLTDLSSLTTASRSAASHPRGVSDRKSFLSSFSKKC